MSIRTWIPATVLALSLAACNAEPALEAPAPTVTPAADAVATPSSEVAVATVAGEPTEFEVIPATLPACYPPTVVTLRWDLSVTHPAVRQVEVWVGPDAKPVLFTVMGGKDETPTGAWATPGAIFRLREPGSGRELARVVLGGPTCPAEG